MPTSLVSCLYTVYGQHLTLSSENSSSDTDDNVSQTAINEAFTKSKTNSALSLTISKVAGASMLFFFSAFTLLG